MCDTPSVMCRYVAYLGPPLKLSELIYKPPNSLVHQASDAMESLTRINADGFGVGWYAPENSPEPAVFKDISPLWNNYNLGSIAGKIRSPAIFAHVRSARSYDPVNRENCHPFARHRLLFMHNGDIPGRASLSRRVAQLADDRLLAKIRGNTDSEMAFTLLLTHLDDPLDGEPEVDELATAMAETLHQLAAWHREAGNTRRLETNFCLTDGRALVATRFSISDRPALTLHWSERVTEAGERYVLVASESLDDRGKWRDVTEGAMVVVRPDLSVEERPLGL